MGKSRELIPIKSCSISPHLGCLIGHLFQSEFQLITFTPVVVMRRHCHQVILLGLLFIGLSQCIGCAPHEESSSPVVKNQKTTDESTPVKSRPVVPALKVLTYNINYGNSDVVGLAQLLKAYQPDIVALQETTPPIEQGLRVQLAVDYPYQSYLGYTVEGLGGDRFGLLSKIPLTHTRFVPTKSGYFGLVTTVFQWQNQAVKLVNVHLVPFEWNPNWHFLEQMAATEKQHRLELGEILRNINVKLPTLLVGDFNSPSQFCVPSELRERGFQDSFATQHPDMKSADRFPTWQWSVGQLDLKYRIDYVFHSPHWETKTCRIGPRTPSDHRPVISEVVLKPPNKN